MIKITQVQKRDKRLVNFDKNKIVESILKAFESVDHIIYESDTAIDIAFKIEKIADKKEIIDIEEIQDLVENYLMESERKDVAKSYIKYRYKQEMARYSKDEVIKAVERKLNGIDVERDNANVDEFSFGGRSGSAASYMWKDLALKYQCSEKTVRNHINNIIYTHDLDHYYIGDHNCITLPLDDLLENGFEVRQTDIRGAGGVDTASQLTAVLMQIQSLNQFGGVAAGHIDWTMIPYIRMSFYKHYKDGLKYVEKVDKKLEFTKKESREISIDNTDIYNMPSAYEYALDLLDREIYQAVEALFHNLNSLQSRSGNQLPFSSMNLGTCILTEGRMFSNACLDVCYAGLGKNGRTSIFPCFIFQSWDKINRYPGTPNYDLYRKALKCTARRLYPNYVNINWSGNAGFDENKPEEYMNTMGL